MACLAIFAIYATVQADVCMGQLTGENMFSAGRNHSKKLNSPKVPSPSSYVPYSLTACNIVRVDILWLHTLHTGTHPVGALGSNMGQASISVAQDRVPSRKCISARLRSYSQRLIILVAVSPDIPASTKGARGY